MLRVDVMQQLRPALAELGRPPTPADLVAALRSHGLMVTDAGVAALMGRLRSESRGAGRLEPLLALDGVTDVVVNGPGEVFVDCGDGLERTDVTFDDDEQVRDLAARLAASAGRRLDDGQPFVDCRLVSGVRVHAVLAGVAHPGTCLSLRVPARRRLTLQEWVSGGSMAPAAAEQLTAMMSARVAFLISGGTGSGKTTLLASLLEQVPHAERIVVVEDARELALHHPHVVTLEGRAANAEGVGGIPMAALVRQSLRMRPDRLVVGEVRGAEVADLLAALNTGHRGGCGTVHANSATDVLPRLEALAALAGMGRDALLAQAGAGLEAVVQVERRGGQRWVREIAVVRAGPPVRVETAVTFSPDPVPGPAWDAWRALL